MELDYITEHTELIELEDNLLEQYDTCQQVLSATWQFLRSTDESLHLPTVKRLLLGLQAIERSIDDEMLDARLGLLRFANLMKKLSWQEQKIRVDVYVYVDIYINTYVDVHNAVTRHNPKGVSILTQLSTANENYPKSALEFSPLSAR